VIRFFRRIRETVLLENKFSKYLLYAIGEIVLVVIGILIALQINTWNEVKKSREKEFSYLERLKEEIEDNIKLTESNLAGATTFKELTLLALKVYSGDTLVGAGQLAGAIEWASYGSPTNVKNNVWQDLVSSGNADLLSNSLLRLAISEYYNLIETHWELFRNNWVDDLNATHDLTSMVLSWKDRNSTYNALSTYRRESILSFPEISVDFTTLSNKLKAIPNIESRLFTMYNLHHIRISFDEREIAALKDILKTLDEEIDRLN
jgi:hypothetical protein